MYIFVVTLHIILSLILIGVVLFQPGKGADIGAAFGGGGGGNMFGPRGPTNFLQQATTAVAVMFMVTSITLARMSDKSTLSTSDVLQEIERLENTEGLGGARPATDADADPGEAAGAAGDDAPSAGEEPTEGAGLSPVGEDVGAGAEPADPADPAAPAEAPPAAE